MLSTRHNNKTIVGIVSIWLLFTTDLILALSTTPAASSSLLTNSQWQLRLNVGLEPGSWMPKRFPGWAESGARLALNVNVDFTGEPSSTRETLVGPKDETFVLTVCGDSGPSTFVSEQGEQQVAFAKTGGWCIQRPTNNIRNARGSLVKPEGLLRFWLDCDSGATKRDVVLRPKTRIYFTTGVWDDPQGLAAMEEEYQDTVGKLQQVVDDTRDTRSKEQDAPSLNLVEQAGDFRTLVGNAQDFDALQKRKENLERASPPKGASVSNSGVQIAPTGSLVIKGNQIPDWLPGSEYLILGTFSTKSLDE
mmetsp:Transcript_31078/g.51338  ORF Transcript_31078/g.51338 Transcript_31078/m.51338 type:complete len:306 (+) Transcript_31078:54-971(+)